MQRGMKRLQDQLIPFMEIHRTTHFLQDGAPCHVSKRIKNFLADKPFEVIDWPGNSPVLNPIENCWNYMKDKLKDKDTFNRQQADHCHPVKGLPEEAHRLDVQEDSEGAVCEWGCYQLLII
jgi:transposase